MTLAVFSLFAQAIGIAGIGFLVADLLVLPGVFYPGGDWSIAGLLPYAIETCIGYWPVLLLCGAGAGTSALLMIGARYRATWFLRFCRVLGWLWMLLVPIGPIPGGMLLYARKHALRRDN